jgi:hypothetical protein
MNPLWIVAGLGIAAYFLLGSGSASAQPGVQPVPYGGGGVSAPPGTPPGPYGGEWGPSGPPPPGTSQADIASFQQAAAQYQQQLAAAPAGATYGNGLPLQPLAPWAPSGTTSD